MLIHQALSQAGTVVCEPVETFRLEIPATALPAVTVTMARLFGLIHGTSPAAGSLALTGTLPARCVPPAGAASRAGQRRGVFTSEVTHYTPVTGPPPGAHQVPPRPRDRHEWFRARPR